MWGKLRTATGVAVDTATEQMVEGFYFSTQRSEGAGTPSVTHQTVRRQASSRNDTVWERPRDCGSLGVVDKRNDVFLTLLNAPIDHTPDCMGDGHGTTTSGRGGDGGRAVVKPATYQGRRLNNCLREVLSDWTFRESNRCTGSDEKHQPHRETLAAIEAMLSRAYDPSLSPHGQAINRPTVQAGINAINVLVNRVGLSSARSGGIGGRLRAPRLPTLGPQFCHQDDSASDSSRCYGCGDGITGPRCSTEGRIANLPGLVARDSTSLDRE